jgi:high-affinity iron transporter
MHKTLLAAALTALLTSCAVGPREDPKTLKNPISPTPESLANGKRLYDRLCAECHGPTGHGDGETAKKLAAAGAPKSPDLTDDKWDHGSSDGEMFAVIWNGAPAPNSEMKPMKGTLREMDVWHIVNYIRSIGPKPPANAAKK